ncbi:MAG: hypothetical protein IPM74_03995 [Crocinitomicaceae bacterium]|nr:hypothetical protein [Crocinitomicaceae bacterium]
MTAVLIKLNDDILTGSNTFKIALKDISIFEEWIKLSDANFPATFRKNADILEYAKILDCN